MVTGCRHTESGGEEREKKCDLVNGLILHGGVKVDAPRAALRVMGEEPARAAVVAAEEEQASADFGVCAAACPANALLLNGSGCVSVVASCPCAS